MLERITVPQSILLAEAVARAENPEEFSEGAPAPVPVIQGSLDAETVRKINEQLGR